MCFLRKEKIRVHIYICLYNIKGTTLRNYGNIQRKLIIIEVGQEIIENILYTF